METRQIIFFKTKVVLTTVFSVNFRSEDPGFSHCNPAEDRRGSMEKGSKLFERGQSRDAGMAEKGSKGQYL
jgi:hypothetical protein